MGGPWWSYGCGGSAEHCARHPTASGDSGSCPCKWTLLRRNTGPPRPHENAYSYARLCRGATVQVGCASGLETRTSRCGDDDFDRVNGFVVMPALAQMELDTKRERFTDSVRKRRQTGGNLGGRPQKVTDRQIANAIRLIDGREAAAPVLRVLGLLRSPFYRKVPSLRTRT
jgi:hypothetical protein